MKKVVIIGDLHGCINTFRTLLDKLPDDIDQIYTVGDLVDRGAGVKEVVQECLDRNIISVRGNHEDMFLDYLRKTNEYDRGVFEMNGGMSTLRSYKDDLPDTKVNGGVATLNSYIDGVPESHLNYFINMPYYIETDDFILSHAGVSTFIEDTFRDCSDRSHMGLMWDRDRKAINLSKFQVFGHTPVTYVKVAWKGTGAPVHVNVDSGCFSKKLLTAVVLPSRELIQVRNTEDKIPNFLGSY